MYALGISCYYHDSAAALLRDGRVVAAVEEERFTRVKFDDSFPANAIHWCLEDAGITPADVETVAFYDKPVLKLERLLDNYITFAPRGLRSFLDVMPKWLHKRLWIKDEIKKNPPGLPRRDNLPRTSRLPRGLRLFHVPVRRRGHTHRRRRGGMDHDVFWCRPWHVHRACARHPLAPLARDAVLGIHLPPGVQGKREGEYKADGVGGLRKTQILRHDTE